MMRPRATRRHAIVGIVLIWALVCGGLGWATHSAVELDRVQAAAAQERSFDELRALALSRLDALIAPHLGRERARPYNHFRALYKPTRVWDAREGSELREPVFLVSPLRTWKGPDWLLLHFQGSQEAGWSSPKLDHDPRFAEFFGSFPEPDPAARATATRWLTALEDGISPPELQRRLELAMEARAQRPAALARPSAGVGTADEASPDSSIGNGTPEALTRSAAEFIRRGARLLQMERADNIDLCIPETVALENLDVEGVWTVSADQNAACVDVWSTSMTPLWLELAGAGRRQLAFVRTVVVQGNLACTLQGVLIDWDRLREVLEAEVRDLFPQARMRPVPTDTPVRSGSVHAMMQTLPAVLDAGRPAAALSAPFVMTSGLTLGLAVAWMATILALIAIAYGTMKYTTLAERRMQFVAAVTHELRTPLTTFQLYSDLLADMTGEEGDRRRKYAETLRTESKRLARLVENVLAYSHMADAEPRLNWTRTTPAALLEAARTGGAERCGAGGKELVIENRCPDDMAIETDTECVVQILFNLVDNACKYSRGSADPRVWLTASAGADATITFEVDDAGDGVSPRDRRHIFQPFRRGDARAEGPSGLGLGLALSQHWAHCIGGRLALKRSPRDDHAFSCFALSLPVSQRA